VAGTAPVSSGAGTSGAPLGGSSGAPVAGSAGAAGSSSSLAVVPVADCAIATPTHWPAAIYVVKCKLDVTSSLTLDPGVVVKLDAGAAIDVHPGGVLNASGTDALPIVLTSIKDDAHGGDTGGDGPTSGARGDWGCQGSCGDVSLRGDGSVLDHVQVLYGDGGVYVQAASTKINGSVFAHHRSYGLVLDGQFPVESTVLSENAFFDNGAFPLRLGKPIFLDSSNVFHDPDHPELKNGKQCVELDTDLNSVVVLGVTELGFLFSGHRISAEVLTPGGVIFKSQGSAIYLDPLGTFFNGLSTTFTSYKDDAAGGDCTGDGESAPAAGDWEGLYIDDGMQADYAAPADSIRYAAKSGTMAVH
jgi:hypothetical protein